MSLSTINPNQNLLNLKLLTKSQLKKVYVKKFQTKEKLEREGTALPKKSVPDNFVNAVVTSSIHNNIIVKNIMKNIVSLYTSKHFLPQNFYVPLHCIYIISFNF